MVEFNRPDVKASRVRKPKFNIDMRKTFSQFQKKHPEFDKLSYLEFKDIAKMFSEFMIGKVCDKRDGIELPEGLGYTFIASVKIKKDVIDMPKSVKVGVKVLAKNWETDGMSPKIFYTNYAMKYKFATREIWSFHANREFSRAASKAFRADWKKYIQPADRRITDLYKLNNAAYSAEPFVADDYNYNEFDI